MQVRFSSQQVFADAKRLHQPRVLSIVQDIKPTFLNEANTGFKHAVETAIIPAGHIGEVLDALDLSTQSSTPIIIVNLDAEKKASEAGAHIIDPKVVELLKSFFPKNAGDLMNPDHFLYTRA